MWYFWTDGYEITLLFSEVCFRSLLEQKTVVAEGGLKCLLECLVYSEPARAELIAVRTRRGFANQLKYSCMSVS